jgi:flagellar basal-body rod protein FlgC
MEGLFTILQNNLDGLKQQLKRLEVISENITNAERVPDKNGKVYHRKVVTQSKQSESKPVSFNDQMSLSLRKTRRKHITGNKSKVIRNRITEPQFEIKEVGQGKLIFDPSNPRANEDGYLLVSDINVVSEMVDMIEASRAYEANVTVMQAAKEMAKTTLKI